MINKLNVEYMNIETLIPYINNPRKNEKAIDRATGAPIYVCHADSEGENFRRAYREAGLKLAECIIWVKNNFVMGRQDYHWRQEPILYGWKEGSARSAENTFLE